MTESPSSQDISTKLERIANRAKEIRDASIMTLAHHIDVNWLHEAYRRTRKDDARPPVRHLANVFFKDPDAGILHVRICGGPGLTRGYPTG